MTFREWMNNRVICPIPHYQKMQNFISFPLDGTQGDVSHQVHSPGEHHNLELWKKPVTSLRACSKGYSHTPSEVLPHVPPELSNSQLTRLCPGISASLNTSPLEPDTFLLWKHAAIKPIPIPSGKPFSLRNFFQHQEHFSEFSLNLNAVEKPGIRTGSNSPQQDS